MQNFQLMINLQKFGFSREKVNIKLEDNYVAFYIQAALFLFHKCILHLEKC